MSCFSKGKRHILQIELKPYVEQEVLSSNAPNGNVLVFHASEEYEKKVGWKRMWNKKC